MDPEFVERLLRLTAFNYCEAIWWRLGDPVPDGNGGWKTPDPDRLRFFVDCSDTFAWATADCELVTADDIDALEAAVREAEAVLGKHRGQTGFMLWVARKRGLRPMPPMYKYIDAQLQPLFDAVGPERTEESWV